MFTAELKKKTEDIYCANRVKRGLPPRKIRTPEEYNATERSDTPSSGAADKERVVAPHTAAHNARTSPLPPAEAPSEAAPPPPPPAEASSEAAPLVSTVHYDRASVRGTPTALQETTTPTAHAADASPPAVVTASEMYVSSNMEDLSFVLNEDSAPPVDNSPAPPAAPVIIAAPNGAQGDTPDGMPTDAGAAAAAACDESKRPPASRPAPPPPSDVPVDTSPDDGIAAAAEPASVMQVDANPYDGVTTVPPVDSGATDAPPLDPTTTATSSQNTISAPDAVTTTNAVGDSAGADDPPPPPPGAKPPPADDDEQPAGPPPPLPKRGRSYENLVPKAFASSETPGLAAATGMEASPMGMAIPEDTAATTPPSPHHNQSVTYDTSPVQAANDSERPAPPRTYSIVNSSMKKPKRAAPSPTDDAIPADQPTSASTASVPVAASAAPATPGRAAAPVPDAQPPARRPTSASVAYAEAEDDRIPIEKRPQAASVSYREAEDSPAAGSDAGALAKVAYSHPHDNMENPAYHTPDDAPPIRYSQTRDKPAVPQYREADDGVPVHGTDMYSTSAEPNPAPDAAPTSADDAALAPGEYDDVIHDAPPADANDSLYSECEDAAGARGGRPKPQTPPSLPKARPRSMVDASRPPKAGGRGTEHNKRLKSVVTKTVVKGKVVMVQVGVEGKRGSTKNVSRTCFAQFKACDVDPSQARLELYDKSDTSAKNLPHSMIRVKHVHDLELGTGKKTTVRLAQHVSGAASKRYELSAVLGANSASTDEWFDAISEAKQRFAASVADDDPYADVRALRTMSLSPGTHVSESSTFDASPKSATLSVSNLKNSPGKRRNSSAKSPEVTQASPGGGDAHSVRRQGFLMVGTGRKLNTWRRRFVVVVASLPVEQHLGHIKVYDDASKARERQSLIIDSSASVRTLIVKTKGVGIHVKCGGGEMKLQALNTPEQGLWKGALLRCVGQEDAPSVVVAGMDDAGVSSDAQAGTLELGLAHEESNTEGGGAVQIITDTCVYDDL
eukprot:m.1158157 g.1158157  ORF g.1158157 m.1158157 type:complete len:1017 (-) comp24499_c0_seq4:628-3678(-)